MPLRRKTFLYQFLITLLILSFFGLNLAHSKESTMRSGTIEDVVFEGLYTYISLKDSAGNNFVVVTEICKAAQDSFLEVIRAEHFPKMHIPPLGGAVSDVYLAKFIKIDGREVIAASNEGLIPQGCKILK